MRTIKLVFGMKTVSSMEKKIWTKLIMSGVVGDCDNGVSTVITEGKEKN